MRLLLQQQACGKRPAPDFICTENDLRYGTDRGSGFRYLRNLEVYQKTVIRRAKCILKIWPREPLKWLRKQHRIFCKKDLELANKSSNMMMWFDDLFKKVKNELISLISADNQNGELCIDLMMIANILNGSGITPQICRMGCLF